MFQLGRADLGPLVSHSAEAAAQGADDVGCNLFAQCRKRRTRLLESPRPDDLALLDSDQLRIRNQFACRSFDAGTHSILCLGRGADLAFKNGQIRTRIGEARKVSVKRQCKLTRISTGGR